MPKKSLQNSINPISKSKPTARRLSALIAIILVSILASNMLQNADLAISSQTNASNYKLTQK